MNQKYISKNKIAFLLSLLICIYIFITHLPGANTMGFTDDESLSLFCWNHNWSSVIGCSRIYSMAPPFDMALGKLHWTIFNTIAPEWTLTHTELAARLYPLIISTVGIGFLLFMIFEVSQSIATMILIWSSAIAINSYFLSMTIDLKFHASLILFNGLSWYITAKILSKFIKTNSQVPQYNNISFWISLLLIISMTSIWFNILSIFTMFTQFIVLTVSILYKNIGSLKKLHKQNSFRFSIVYSFVSGAAFVYYWIFKIARHKDPLIESACATKLGAMKSFSEVFNGMMPIIGSIFFLIPLLLLVLTYLIKVKKSESKINCTFINSMTITAIILPILLFTIGSLMAWYASCSRKQWEPRHIAWTMMALFLPFSAAVHVVKANLNSSLFRKLEILMIILSIITLSTVGLKVGQKEVVGGDRLIQLRKTIRKFNLKPVGVIGITTNPDRTLARDETTGSNMAFAWEYYVKGLTGLPNIKEVFGKEFQNGGLLSYPCKDQTQFKELTQLASDQKVIVDFCIPKKIVYRSAENQ